MQMVIMYVCGRQFKRYKEEEALSLLFAVPLPAIAVDDGFGYHVPL